MMWDQVLAQDEVVPYWVIPVSVLNLLNIVGQYRSQIRCRTADNIENIDIGLHIGEYRPENYILLCDIKEFENIHSFLAIFDNRVSQANIKCWKLREKDTKYSTVFEKKENCFVFKIIRSRVPNAPQHIPDYWYQSSAMVMLFMCYDIVWYHFVAFALIKVFISTLPAMYIILAQYIWITTVLGNKSLSFLFFVCVQTENGDIITVMRIWLEKEKWIMTKTKAHNQFQDNYFYIQKFNRNMQPINSGSLLGIPTPVQWTVGDGPIEPRLYQVNNTAYVTFNTGIN